MGIALRLGISLESKKSAKKKIVLSSDGWTAIFIGKFRIDNIDLQGAFCLFRIREDAKEFPSLALILSAGRSFHFSLFARL